MKLTYDQAKNAYVMDCTYDERLTPKAANFTWHRIVKNKWATNIAERAARLIQYADSETRKRLQAVADERSKNLELSRAASLDIEIPCPEGLEYLPYQRAGIAFAMGKQAVLFGDEMGLGKTIQLIGFINTHPDIKTALIICPASLKLNWKRELEKWLTRPMSIAIADTKTGVPNSDIVIVNYDILSKLNCEDFEWDLVACDECHYIKNEAAQRSRAIRGHRTWNKAKREWNVKQEAIPARYKVAMTGTPIPNRTMEIWTILNWLDPGAWPNSFQFGKRYAAGANNGFGWEFKGGSNLEELQDKLRSTIMVRRLKADVLSELPPKRRAIVVIPSNGATEIVEREKAAYEQHKAALEEARASRDLAKAAGDEPAYKAAVEKLRSIAGLQFSSISKVRAELAVAKAPHVAEHVRDIMAGTDDDYKVVVFAHHREVVEILVDTLNEFGVVQITGDTSMTARQEAVDRFQTDPTIRVFVGNIQAAGVGLTLTASAHVIFAELDWTPANVMQAEDRCILEGQPILTTNGWVPIENIEIGDMVIAKDGKPHAVTDKWSRKARGSHAHNSKDITEIEVRGWNETIKVTTDHRMLTTHGWVEASHLKPRDRLIMPEPYENHHLASVPVGDAQRISTTFETPEQALFGGYYDETRVKPVTSQRNGRLVSLPNQIQLTDEALFSMGYYIGDGFASTAAGKGRFVSFSGHKEQKATYLETCRQWVETIGVSSSLYDQNGSLGCELRSFSGELAFWFEAHFGRTLEDKHLPEWIFDMSVAQRYSFIAGWVASDGYQRHTNNGAGSLRTEIITASRTLAAQAARLLISVGISPNVTYGKHSRAYSIAWTDGQDQNMVITSITQRTCNKTERVYDLTVDSEASFTVGLAVAHNCHRIGQLSSVLIEHLVFDGSLDARMAKTIVAKQEVIDKALDLPYVLEEPVIAGEEEEQPRKANTFQNEPLTDEQLTAIHKAMRFIAQLDEDMAAIRNGVGFNRYDGRIGHSLAMAPALNQAQGQLGLKLVRKYRNQLTPATIAAAGI